MIRVRTMSNLFFLIQLLKEYGPGKWPRAFLFTKGTVTLFYSRCNTLRTARPH
jgi:hypothetical protein